MKKKTLKDEPVDLKLDSNIADQTRHDAQHLTTDLPLAEKDQVKQAEEELLERIKKIDIHPKP